MSAETSATPLSIESIFHPTDFSEASELAFVHALKLALAGQSDLIILHARAEDDGPPRWADYPGVRATLVRWGALEEGSRPEAVAELGIGVEKVAAHGLPPLRAIRSFLDEHPARLLVLATHGREGLPRWLRPSVAEPVARHAGSTTLFVPHGARGFVAPETGESLLRRILVPVDSEPRPNRAVDAAAALVQALGTGDATLTLLHVGEAGEAPAVEVPELAGAKWERVTRGGPVVETLVAAAGESDLVVMATEGREGFFDALRGSTTEQLLRRAPCPVLAVTEG